MERLVNKYLLLAGVSWRTFENILLINLNYLQKYMSVSTYTSSIKSILCDSIYSSIDLYVCRWVSNHFGIRRKYLYGI